MRFYMKLHCSFSSAISYEKKGNSYKTRFLLFPLQENESKKEKGTKHGKPMELIDHKDQIVMENRHWRFDCRFFMCFCRNKPKQTDV